MNGLQIVPTLMKWSVPIFLLVIWYLRGWRNVAPDYIGVVQRNWGGGSMASDQMIASRGENGYQAKLLSPGWQWVPFLMYSVRYEPVVQIASDECGLVVSQVGQSPPIGARTAEYKNEFGDFQNLAGFLEQGGQKGRQRPVLRPGTYRIHPIAFLVITPSRVYGIPMDNAMRSKKSALSLAEYRRFLPGQGTLERLEAIVRNFAGDALDWDVNVILRAADVPRVALGGANAALGHTTWLGMRRDSVHDASDLYLSPPYVLRRQRG